MNLFKSFVSYGTILTVSIATIVSPLRAETFELSPEEKACVETLDACTDAVNKSDVAIKDKQKVIDIQKKQAEELTKQLVEAQNDANSWLHNPWLWFFVGASIGGLAAGLVIKK